MKKLVFLLLVASIGYAQTIIDTVRFARPSGNATAYQAGDIVRAGAATGGALLGIRTITSGTQGSRGYVVAVQLYADTCNVSGANFTVILFSDTTGLYAVDGYQLPADNALYQSNFAMSKYRIGTVSLSFSTYGSTAGGATMAGASAENLNIPFKNSTGKLYAVIVCDGAYTPKNGGLFRLHVATERTY